MDAPALRAAFPVLSERHFLNAGTCGPVPAVAAEAARDAWALMAREGRSHAFYGRVAELAAELRRRYARLLGADPADVALTTSSSDGMARVIAGLRLGPGDEVLTAEDEHPGLLGPLAVVRAAGATVRVVPLAEIAAAAGPATRLVACSHVAWASGAVAPSFAGLPEDVPVLLDGAQGFGAVPLEVPTLGCAFYAGSGQKWPCGPVGTGALWVAPAWRERVAVVAPSFVTLADPGAGLDAVPADGARRFDAPAHDLPALAAAVAAFDVLDAAGWDAVQARAATLAAQLADRLRERGLDVLPRGATPLVAWADADAAATVAALGARGVVVRDLPGRARVRASVGAWNDERDLDALLDGL